MTTNRGVINTSVCLSVQDMTLFIILPSSNECKSLFNTRAFYWSTVKAPNFDRVFMKNIFFLRIFLGDPPWKKSTERVKSRSSKCQNQNFYSEIHREAKEEFTKVSKLPSGLLTSTGTNNSWRSSPPEKSVWQVWHEYCSKNIVGKCKKLKLPHIYKDSPLKGSIVNVFQIIQLLRRNVTWKCIFDI